jgi:O-antigen ligase
LVVTVAVAFSYDDVVVSGSAAVGRDSTLSGRSDLWPEVVDAIGERPVAGTGIGGVWLRPNESPTREILDTLPPSLRDAAVYAHSGYLDVALQVGLLGGIILAVLVSRAVFRSVRLILYGETKYYSLPFVALILVLLANVTESRVFNDQAWVVFVAVFSLLLGSDVGAASKGEEEEMADVGPQLGVAATIQVRA